MDNMTAIAVTSITAAALCMAIGSIAPALGEAKAIPRRLARSRSNPMKREPSAAHSSSGWP